MAQQKKVAEGQDILEQEKWTGKMPQIFNLEKKAQQILKQ